MRLFSGFGRRHVLIALVFSLVIQLTHLGYAALGKDEFRPVPMLTWAVIYFFMVLMALGCAVAAENLLGESAGTTLRIVLAVLAAATVTTLAVEMLLYLLPQSLVVALEGKERTGFVNSLHRIAHGFTIAAGWSMLLIPMYTMLQASRRATERLHTMRLAALAAERRVVEGDLRAMQGRVDPELLFDSLLEVDHAYAERGVQAGQEALDALIRFLRAALPSDAAATPTVAGEQELAEAYLALMASRADQSPRLDISVAPEARTLPMPAMLLLPLVRWALDDRSATRLAIHARRRDAALEVSVSSNSRGDGSASESNIAGVRERLSRLFAGQASLDVSVSADARQARLLIPAS
jgi:LytS/YehU family sensor histidine kinase